MKSTINSIIRSVLEYMIYAALFMVCMPFAAVVFMLHTVNYPFEFMLGKILSLADFVEEKWDKEAAHE